MITEFGEITEAQTKGDDTVILDAIINERV